MSTVNRQTGFTPNFLMLWRDVLQPIDLMLNTGGDKTEELLGHIRRAIRKPRGLLIERPGRNNRNLNDAIRGILIYLWKKENTLYAMRFIYLTGLLCWDKVKNYSPLVHITEW